MDLRYNSCFSMRLLVISFGRHVSGADHAVNMAVTSAVAVAFTVGCPWIAVTHFSTVHGRGVDTFVPVCAPDWCSPRHCLRCPRMV